MLAALFVQVPGPYTGLRDVDPWGEERDARRYPGPWPVVAHPPCARWCRLAGLVQHRYPALRKGEDGGCFESALASVRRWGGVLEHPAYSDAWPAFGLARPRHGEWLPAEGGWTTQVSQAPYGHRARKLTWLYVAGAEPPGLDWSVPKTTVALSWCNRRGNGSEWKRGAVVERMSKRESARTPEPFRDLLLEIARSVTRAEF